VEDEVSIASRVIVVIGLLAVAGCAASVRYAPRVPGILPGYVDQQLGKNTYQVRIGEAWPKDWADLEKFAMYRAAEITVEKDRRYFVVLNASSQVSHYAIVTPSTTTTTGTATTYGSTTYVNATSTTTGGGTATISGGWYTLDFKVVDEVDLSAYSEVVDSHMVMDDLQYFIEGRRPK
jgi:hypothetical protein